MKLTQFKFLSDENIHADVVQFLRDQNCDVIAVPEIGLFGADDEVLLERAVAEDRVVVTHDSDFGTLAILAGKDVYGIIFLRPGHIDPEFTIETLRVVIANSPELTPPFILVAQRTGPLVQLRLRSL